MTAEDNVSGVRSDPVLKACVVLTIIAISLINLQLAQFDTPRLIDWPNHLARHQLQCSMDPLAGIGQHYIYNFVPIPNATAEWIHMLAPACWSVEVTQKILIQFATTGLMLATVFLHASIWRRWSLWPVISACFMYHSAFAFGFENFVLALPPTLVALAVWFLTSNMARLPRTLILAPLALAIYFMHIYAFGFLMLAWTFLEFQVLWDKRRETDFARCFWSAFVAMLLISILPGIHLLNIIGQANGIDTSSSSSTTLLEFLTMLASPLGTGVNTRLTFNDLAESLALLLFIMIFFMASRFPGGRVAVERRGIFPLIALAVVTMCIPSELFKVHFTHIRFPTLVACFWVAIVDCRHSRYVGLVLAMILVTVAFLRTDRLVGYWKLHDEEVAELRQLTRYLDSDDRLLVLGDMTAKTVTHSHSAAYLAMDTKVFLPSIFTGANALSPRPDIRDRDISQYFPPYWREFLELDRTQNAYLKSVRLVGWDHYFSHVLVLSAVDQPDPGIIRLGRLLEAGTFFSLYALNSN
ncbi:hypothetical protein [Ruegeria sp. Ofav3-42]|uniref:hypothetical protein n=1 Tax=Ruegeria sp. Ofav3-42 TaxID=2917759 RepID=UPI001EF46F06|nr:hypothetical protein [Ruegeria sp. Ofav3-42]MCG7522017.1 hypothetical protein [Ruegeria sp. Ofav3-42]